MHPRSCLVASFAFKHGGQTMINNKDRNSRGKVKSAAEEHTRPKTEPSARELRRKTMVKKVKRLKIKR
jgi:hypothetical protein